MSKFKVGDRVKIVGYSEFWDGQEFTIIRLSGDCAVGLVKYPGDAGTSDGGFPFGYLKLVESPIDSYLKLYASWVEEYAKDLVDKLIMPKLKYSNHERELIKSAENNICGAFIWTDTPQGHTYWADVVLNLSRLKDQHG